MDSFEETMRSEDIVRQVLDSMPAKYKLSQEDIDARQADMDQGMKAHAEAKAMQDKLDYVQAEYDDLHAKYSNLWDRYEEQIDKYAALAEKYCEKSELVRHNGSA